ncbi:probable calcium-binding protein CML21 isoform X1 [Salvia hispanica]|uniref:probable calcium-binding protein CML21 isoform X1 n=1 Tax=Salvia hispanica TaxID=49212 RepID=UPI002009B184|nr:probable calcium-binding protein CML21 isoform X1 [Salvia hispanica]XP_047945023.1 probable calcium-binding protein CML21 isoform X1 [Salvia hispanica]
MGGVLDKDGSPDASVPKTKIEAKIIEAVQKREVQGSSITAFNSIILKFPKIDESFRKCISTFEEFDEDGNGSIDPQELKNCFHKLEINFTDEEIDGLFEECDINDDMRITFNEFIVLLCLVNLLQKDPAAENCKSQVGGQSLKATFETLVDAFVFLDKNQDGYVSKNEMVQAINETNAGERSSGMIAMRRFEEMDWDKNGMVNYKEFLFAFTRWVGFDENDDEADKEDDS